MIFQGVQAVALPLVQDFGYTREIEDRVLAPMPVWAVAMEKVASGAIQALIAALVVFPLAAFIPATPVHLHVHWFYLLTILPLAAVMSAALGLTIGTRVEPRQVPLIFSLLVIPMTFLGAVYYPWKNLTPLPWLKSAVLVNPLVYMSEGMRLSLTKGVPHMPAIAIYGALIVFTAVFLRLGIAGFKRRVLELSALSSSGSGPRRARRRRRRARRGAARSTRLRGRARGARTTRARRSGCARRPRRRACRAPAARACAGGSSPGPRAS